MAAKALRHYTRALARFEPRVTWITDDEAALSFKAKGAEVRGSLEVHPDRYETSLDAPLLLAPFKGLAVQVLEKEMRAWIANAERSDA